MEPGSYRYPEPERPSSRASHCSDRPSSRYAAPKLSDDLVHPRAVSAVTPVQVLQHKLQWGSSKLIVCCHRNVRYQMPCLKRIPTRFQQSALLLQLVLPFIQLCRWLLASLPGRKSLQQTWCSFTCVPWKYRVGHGFVNQCLFIFLVALTQQPPSSVNKWHFCTLVWGFALQA